MLKGGGACAPMPPPCIRAKDTLDLKKTLDGLKRCGILGKGRSCYSHWQAEVCRVTGSLLGWIRDFLSARTMKVSVSGCLSSSRNVLSGVPQGSVLGPLLFIVYVNCLSSFILNNCKLFADDLKLYLRVPTDFNSESYRGLQACQNNIDAVVRISELWGLALNTKKRVLLRFGGSPAGLGVLGELHTYLIHNTVLSESDC